MTDSAAVLIFLSKSYFSDAECCLELCEAVELGMAASVVFVVVDGCKWDGKPFPDLSDVPPGQGRTYHAIARHYGWALGQLFDEKHHSKVIILEDDMEIAPDFFDYFAAAGGLLYEDPTLLCVSAWNDNGQRVGRVARAHTHTHTHSCTRTCIAQSMLRYHLVWLGQPRSCVAMAIV